MKTALTLKEILIHNNRDKIYKKNQIFIISLMARYSSTYRIDINYNTIYLAGITYTLICLQFAKSRSGQNTCEQFVSSILDLKSHKFQFTVNYAQAYIALCRD